MVPAPEVRLGFDATPLLGRQTGVGRYTRRLVEALLALPHAPALTATAFSLRGHAALAERLPPGVVRRARPVPVRLLQACWARSEMPPVEWLCGPVDVFHGTNFVLPPLRRAHGVVTVHDLSFLRYPDTVSADSLRYRRLVPRSVARAEVVCALTAAMGAEIAAEYRLAPDRIEVTHPGVDETWFTATPLDRAERDALRLPERYLLAVGTLEPRKNLAHLLAAYAELRAAEPGTPPLVCVGPAGWGPQLRADLLPAGSLILTGYLDDAVLRGVVAGATCLVYPSMYEGFGLPPVEALACGVPVVATDLAVTREVLGDAAILVTGQDRDALISAIASALVAPRDPTADAARRNQAARWTWAGCARQAMVAYRRASAA